MIALACLVNLGSTFCWRSNCCRIHPDYRHWQAPRKPYELPPLCDDSTPYFGVIRPKPEPRSSLLTLRLRSPSRLSYRSLRPVPERFLFVSILPKSRIRISIACGCTVHIKAISVDSCLISGRNTDGPTILTNRTARPLSTISTYGASLFRASTRTVSENRFPETNGNRGMVARRGVALPPPEIEAT